MAVNEIDLLGRDSFLDEINRAVFANFNFEDIFKWKEELQGYVLHREVVRALNKGLRASGLGVRERCKAVMDIFRFKEYMEVYYSATENKDYFIFHQPRLELA